MVWQGEKLYHFSVVQHFLKLKCRALVFLPPGFCLTAGLHAFVCPVCQPLCLLLGRFCFVELNHRHSNRTHLMVNVHSCCSKFPQFQVLSGFCLTSGLHAFVCPVCQPPRLLQHRSRFVPLIHRHPNWTYLSNFSDNAQVHKLCCAAR